MSSIDNRIVQMQFDNSQFEKGAQTSMSTLDKLKQKLDFSGAKDSFSEVSSAANSMDFSGLQAGIQAIQDRFSTWGIVGMQVISELTSSAINMGKQLANITIGQINTGGKNRASNIQKANLMLEGLFDKEANWQSKVANAMGDASVAVNGTAYGLDEAALAASQLAASGIEIKEWAYDAENASDIAKDSGDQMTKSLMAISGLAAMTSSSYSDIAQIFTTTAGNGRLMSEQLLSLSSRGINAAATLAEQWGKTEAQVREMVSDGKVTYDMFAQGMFDAYADQAYKANRTLTGVISNCKAALSKLGADIWTPLIQNTSDSGEGLVNFVQVLDSVREKLNNFRTAFSKPLGANSDLTDTSQWGAWVTFVDNCCKAVKSSIDSIDATKMGEQLNTIVTNALPKLWEIIQQIGSGLSKIGTVVKSLGSKIKSWNSINKLSTTIDAVKKSVGSIFDNLPKFDDILSGIKKTTEALIDKVMGNDNLKSIAVIISNIVKAVRNFQDELGKNDAVKNFTSMGKGLGGIFTTIVKIVEKLSGLLPPIGKILGEIADVALDAAGKIGNFFSDLGKNVSNSSLISGFFDTVKGALDKVAGLDLHPMNLLTEAVTNLQNAFASAVQWIKDVWGDFCEFMQPLIDQVKEGLKNLWDAISSPFSGDSNISALDALTTFVKALAAIKIASLGDDLVNLFSKLGDSLKTFQKNIKGISATNFEKIAKSLLLLAGAVFILASVDGEALTKSLLALAGGIGELVGAFYLLKGKNVKDAKEAVKGKDSVIAAIEDTIKSFSANSMNKVLTLANAIIVLAAALKIISTIDGPSLGRALVGMAFAMIELGVLTYAMSQIKTEGALANAGSIALIALSLIPIAASIALLSLVDANQMYASMFALAIAIGLFGTIITIMSNMADPAGAIASAASLALLAIALVPLTASLIALSVALSALGEDGGNTLSAAMTILVVAIGLFALIIGALSNLGDAAGAIAGAASILLVSLSLIPLTAAIVALSLCNLGNAGTALGMLLVALGVIALILAVMSLNAAAAVAAIPAAASILIVTASLLLIAAALLTLSVFMKSIDLGSLSASMVLFGVALAAICTALIAVSPVAVSALVAAAAFLVIAAAITVLVVALMLLTSLDTVSLALNLGILAVALAALALNAGALAVIGPLLLTAAGGLAAFGAAMIVFGAGLASVSAAILVFASAVTAVINTVVNGVSTIVNGLTDILNGIANFLGTAIGIVANVFDTIVNTVKDLLGIHSPSTVFADIGENIIMGLINGIKDVLSSLLSMIGQIPQQMVDALGDLGSAAITAGKNFIDGLINGISSGIGKLISKVGSIAGSMLDKVASVFDSHSPSKETAKLGKYFDQGLIVGMQKYSSDVNDTASAVGKEALSGLNSVFDWTDVDSNPVITPVLDLSEIQNGSNSLAAMMNQGYSYTAAASIASSFESPEAAKNAAFNKTMSSAMSDLIAAQQAESDPTYSFSIPLSINGRQIAKATRQYTKSELDALDTINNRKGGIK